jgi:ABC-type maltose transport system permease subunit
VDRKGTLPAGKPLLQIIALYAFLGFVNDGVFSEVLVESPSLWTGEGRFCR